MSRRPKRTKPDSNQKQIVEDLRKLGFDVDIICDLPGLYDLIVSGIKYFTVKVYNKNGAVVDTEIWEKCSVRVEVKSEKGKFNETEQEYFDKQIHKDSYVVARKTEDVLKWFGKI